MYLCTYLPVEYIVDMGVCGNYMSRYHSIYIFIYKFVPRYVLRQYTCLPRYHW